MGTLAALAMFVAGCATTGSDHSEVDKQYKKFQTERPAAVVVNKGDKDLGIVAIASAKVYDSTVKYLDEYISATNDNKQYQYFINDFQAKMERDKNLSAATAIEMTLAEAKKNDEGKALADQTYPKIISGHQAVIALKPTDKLEELAPLATDAATVAASAKELVNSFRGFDPSTLEKFSSAEGISAQADFSVKALDFLNDRYQQEAEFEKHLKK